MDPNQPVAPTPGPGVAPQPNQPPIPQPQQPMPQTPVPTQQAPLPPQPPLGGVPVGQGQPPVQPMPPAGPTMPVPGANPAFSPAPAGGSKSRLKTILIAVGSLIATLFVIGLIFTFVQSAAYKEEIKVGADFIQAVQKNNYEQAGKLMDPELGKLCQRAVDITTKVNQPITLDACFKDMLNQGFAPSVGQGEPVKELVTNGKFGDQEYAVVIYKVGSSNVSVLELYKSSGEPYVLMTAPGRKEIKDEKEFESSYNTYKSMLDSVNAQLDSAEQQIEASPQSATTELDGLFNSN